MLTYDKGKFEKTGALIGSMVVDEDDEAFLINSDGVIIRIRAKEVSVLGRATQGVRIMKVEDETRIVAMTKAMKSEGEETEEESEEEEGEA